MEKEQRFKEGIQRWIDNDYNGLFDYATGVGKTSIGISCGEYYLRNIDDRAAITVITPNEIISNQWKKRIEGTLIKKFHRNFNVFSVNYLIVNNFQIKTDLIIFDEIHEYASEKAYQLIRDNIQYNKYVALTASTDDKKFYKFKDFVTVDKITEADAIKYGFIADFIEYNLQVEMTEKEKYMYDKYTEQIDKHKVYFEVGKAHYLTVANCVISGGKNIKDIYYSASQWAKAVANKHNYDPTLGNDQAVTPASINNRAYALTRAIRERTQLLREVYSKQIMTIKLLEKFPDKKAIVFSESTEVCDKLYTMAVNIGIKATIFHSKIKPRMLPGKTGKLIKHGAVRLKRKAMEDMETGEAMVLITGSSFDKGYNEESIKMTITVSGNRDSTKYTQRGGRAKRVKGESTALLVNMYVKGTVDEDSIKSRQRNATHLIIETDSIESINYKGTSNSKFNINDFPTL